MSVQSSPVLLEVALGSTTVIPVISIKILSYGLKICNKHLLQVPGYHVS